MLEETIDSSEGTKPAEAPKPGESGYMETKAAGPKKSIAFDISEAKLENDLQLYFVRSPSEAIAIHANVNVGSIYEPPEISGVSHFTEHMLFKGTEKYLSREDIYYQINLFGDDLSAETSENSMPFGMKVIPEDFEPALKIFRSILFNSTMRVKEFEDEKPIVIEEINCADENPLRYILNKFEEVLFDGSCLAQSEIGTKKTIMGMPHHRLVEFYKKFFTPANTTLFIVGDLPFDEVLSAVKRNFVSDKDPVGTPQESPKIELPQDKQKRVVINRDIVNVYTMIGNIIPPVGLDEACVFDVLSAILYSSIQDRTLNKNPISYEMNVILNPTRIGSIFASYQVCSPENYQLLRDLVVDEFRQMKNLKPSMALERRIADAKISLSKSFVLENTDVSEKAKTLLNFWLNWDIHDVNTYLGRLESVTMDQVIAAAQKYIRIDAMTEVVLGKPVTEYTKPLDLRPRKKEEQKTDLQPDGTFSVTPYQAEAADEKPGEQQVSEKQV